MSSCAIIRFSIFSSIIEMTSCLGLCRDLHASVLFQVPTDHLPHPLPPPLSSPPSIQCSPQHPSVSPSKPTYNQHTLYENISGVIVGFYRGCLFTPPDAVLAHRQDIFRVLPRYPSGEYEADASKGLCDAQGPSAEDRVARLVVKGGQCPFRELLGKKVPDAEVPSESTPMEFERTTAETSILDHCKISRPI